MSKPELLDKDGGLSPNVPEIECVQKLSMIKGFEHALKDEIIPNLFWVFEPGLAGAIAAAALSSRLGTFGLEIGFGEQPSNIRNTDANQMLWILAESQAVDVRSAKENIARFWLPVPNAFAETSALAPILAVVLNVPQELCNAAAIIMMRNPRRDMIPAFSTLQPGQQFHLIIDSEHATTELGMYRTTLNKNGYDGSKLLPIAPPRFSMCRAGNMLSYELVVKR